CRSRFAGGQGPDGLLATPAGIADPVCRHLGADHSQRRTHGLYSLSREIADDEGSRAIRDAQASAFLVTEDGTMAMLEARGLVKIYGRRRVVDGVNFEVERGEIVGLLGPNGAGKTTSFRITCGMIEADEGTVTLSEVDVTDWPMYRRARNGKMGYLAQESSVF